MEKSTSKYRVQDYSNHEDINKYIASILGNSFYEYRCMYEEASEGWTVPDFPIFLVFELQYFCNLNCIMCLNSSANRDLYSYNGSLSTDQFKNIIHEASNYNCPSLTFAGINEPLLDNRIAYFVTYAKKNGFIDTMINTNATLLNATISKKLINSGLTRIRIGFDGATDKTYESIRVGANFHKVKENIINFINIRNRMQSSLPVVRISMVNMNETKDEVDDFIFFWKQRADYVTIQQYIPHEFTEEKLSFVPSLNNNEKIMGKPFCALPNERLFIRGNGDVLACCNPVFGPLVGNIKEKSLYEIWHGKKINKIRHYLKHHEYSSIPSCAKCLRYNLGLNV